MKAGPGGFRRLVARLLFGRDIVAEFQSERERLSADLSRRLVELNSLQELSQALSASLRFDHVVAEVARHAMRALDGSGAVVLLAPEDGGAFEVAAANGSLAGHLHRRIDPESGGLALEAIIHERLELRPGDGTPVDLFTGARAGSAVAAPLRAHGLTVGAIAVADRLVGAFTADDGRLLSTAATHAAVVLANARFFELMRVGKEQWEATFDALAEGIALVDASGVIRRANTAIAGMLGQPITRVIGRHLGEALFGEKGGMNALIGAAQGDQHFSPVVRRSEPLGRTLRLLVSGLGRPTAEATAVVVVEDITEQKALEAQLMQSEKLVAVGTMVSGVAHELNNPLTSIAGLSELLLEQEGAAGAHAEHLKVIYDQAERASRIVRNLLSFARKSAAESAPLDLGDVAMRTVTLMSYEMRRADIAVETNIQADLPPVLGSRDQLQQVVLNLLTNAAYALGTMPEGAPRRITVSVASETDRVVLKVSDTGPGIQPESAAQLFDPFYTTKPPGEGTGLGLFLSYGVAETHGGSLAVEPRPGPGATFVLALPRARSGVPAAPARAEPAAPRDAGRTRRILVVDDDAAVRRLVGVLFRHDGHTVDEAESGTDALRLAGATEYDLVITDRRAVVGSEPFGVALARARPAWQGRVIVAAADRTSTMKGDWAAALRLLRKPFNLRDLRAAASDVWTAAGAA
ncbi:MAG: ATP-binding protein [Gemmatimonadales bacterium]